MDQRKSNLYLRREDDGHRIVEDALAEKQSVQVHVYLELIEDRQHCY